MPRFPFELEFPHVIWLRFAKADLRPIRPIRPISPEFVKSVLWTSELSERGEREPQGSSPTPHTKYRGATVNTDS